MDENRNWTIVLADGTEIKNLGRNGDNYISYQPISAAVFEGNCSPIVFKEGEDVVGTWLCAELIQVKQYGDEYWLAFREISEKEIAEAKIRADIDYIAMMSEIDLEEA